MLDTLDALDTPDASKTSDGVKNVTDERTNGQGDSRSMIENRIGKILRVFV